MANYLRHGGVLVVWPTQRMTIRAVVHRRSRWVYVIAVHAPSSIVAIAPVIVR
jgi:hypothetical protein